MKLKRLLSGVTAAMIALSSVAVASFTAGAADYTGFGSKAIVFEGLLAKTGGMTPESYPGADGLEKIQGESGDIKEQGPWNIIFENMDLSSFTTPSVFIQSIDVADNAPGVTAEVGTSDFSTKWVDAVKLTQTSQNAKYAYGAFTLGADAKDLTDFGIAISTSVSGWPPPYATLTTRIIFYDAAEVTTAPTYDFVYEAQRYGAYASEIYTEDQYTPASYTAFTTAIAAADALTDESSANDAYNVINGIDTAIAGLSYDFEGYKAVVYAKLDAIFNLNNYTDASIKAVNDAKAAVEAISSTATLEEKIEVVAALEAAIDGLTSKTAPKGQATMMFTDANWQWGNWGYAGTTEGFGNDVQVNKDGRYTVSIDASSITGLVKQLPDGTYAAENSNVAGVFDATTGKVVVPAAGANVFCIDIKDLIQGDDATKKYDTSIQAVVTSIKCDDEEIPFNPSKILCGNIEDDNANFRIEIANAYGDTNTDPAIDVTDIAFANSLSVTFEIAGVNKTEAFKDAKIAEINARINKINALKASDYTATTYTAAKTAVTNAEAALINPDSTATDLMKADNALRTAIKGLKTAGVLPSINVAISGVASSYKYAAKALKPTPVVKYDGKTLKKNVDYTVTYGTNVYVGSKAYVKITGKGNYTGSIVKYFSIVKPTAYKSAFTKITAGKKTLTVTYKKTTGSTKYKVYVCSNKSFKGARVVTTSKTSVKFTKLTGGKKYYVKVVACRPYKTSKTKTAYTYASASTIKAGTPKK